ncbi:MAG: hypothetical protein KatS3mg095_0468 [Candidatus Parcubacteria bacterium]|nr:MAG: hypothetical protein KatS3mg095_0468 [Candidatus Parcubacteria bacterium]
MKVTVLVYGKELKKFEKDIRRVTLETCNKINKKIKLGDFTIIYEENPQKCIPRFGHSGQTLSGYLICISLNPQFKNFKNKVIKEEIPRAIAHEIIHLIRWNLFKPTQKNLLYAIIEEGLCQHFDLEICGENLSLYPWSTALKENEIKKYLKRAKKYFNSKDISVIYSWKFGNEKLKIPHWAGYSLGFYLIKKYLEKTNKKVSEIYHFDAKRIFYELNI